MANFYDPDTNSFYNYDAVRQLTLINLVRGISGMSMGVFIAAQPAWPALKFDLAWTRLGRFRPTHADIVIFVFAGGALFATSFYVLHAHLSRSPDVQSINLF